jgi:RsiW-degrading membrane proteinase PrsW (M82 family)
MEFIIYLSFLIPLAIAVMLYAYLKYKFREAPSGLLIRSFFLGMVSIVLVIFIQILANYFELDNLKNIRRIIFYALVISSFFAELGKFFILKVFIYPSKRFRSPVDGIIFSVMVAMGFATANNLFYFFQLSNLSVNTINAFTAGPANVIFGVLMGFFIGLGKLRQMRFVDSTTGLLSAVFFHALYSFCLLTNDYKLLAAFFIGSIIIAVSLSLAAIRISDDEDVEKNR